MENTTTLATSNTTELANIPQDMLDYLNELDKKATAKPIGGAYFPELRVIASDKMSDDLNKAKGNFVLIGKDQDGNKQFETLDGVPHVVVLRVANQYTMFDEIEQKVVYSTNEFERGDRIMLKNSEGVVMYDGDQSGLKTWALQYLPDPKSKPESPKHLLKFRFVYYVLMIDRWDEGNPVASVYRLYASVSSMDNIREYDNSLKGAHIRYVTEISTEKKDNGGVRFYPIKPKTVGEVPMENLIKFLNVKKDLEEAIRNVTEGFFNGKEFKEELDETVPTLTTVNEVKDMPFPNDSGVSQDEVNAVFG